MTDMPQRRKEDKIGAKIWRFFYRFFFMVGVAMFISVVMLVITMSRMMNYTPSSLPDEMVLTLAIKSDLVEVAGRPSFSQPLLRPATTLQDVVAALDLAAKDARVKALVVKLEDMKFSAAQVQELRDALLRFRAADKRTYIYADSYGGFQSGMGQYYLASAFDEIWLQPVGVVSAAGVASEVPFLRDLLDKIGIETQFTHQGIYKSAPESLTERQMTPPHREMMQSLVSDLAAQMSGGIAKARGLYPEDVRRLVDMSPHGDKDALRLKLVDRIGYFDEMVLAARRAAKAPEKDKAEKKEETQKAEDPAKETAEEKEAQESAAEKAGKEDKEEKPGVETVALMGYSFVTETQALGKGVRGFMSKMTRREAPASELKKKDKIALIYGSGEIVPFTPRAQASPFGGTDMAADKIVQAFRSVQNDEGVAAVIFRIDSPGGSPAASETIRRAVMETRRKGKPVVVSMSGSAASGGYWIAADADKIVAQPGTLTGSIGVFGGKFFMGALWDKLGVNWDAVSEGENARMWSSNQKFTPAQMQRFESLMAETYEAFLDRVAAGRNIPRDEVKKIAEGRVYTGRQALEVGLVDDLGGIDVALKHARALAEIGDDEDVPLVRFPPRKSTLEMFITLATEGALFYPQFTISAGDIAAALDESLPPQGVTLRAPYAELR